MQKRRLHLTHTLLLGTIAMAVPGIPALLATSTAPTASAAPLGREDLVVPDDVERVVVGDMVVDWIGGAPEGAADALTSSGVPVDLTVPDVADAATPTDDQEHDHQSSITSIGDRDDAAALLAVLPPPGPSVETDPVRLLDALPGIEPSILEPARP